MEKTRTLPSDNYEYRFVVDGEWRNDLNCTDNDVLHVVKGRKERSL